MKLMPKRVISTMLVIAFLFQMLSGVTFAAEDNNSSTAQTAPGPGDAEFLDESELTEENDFDYPEVLHEEESLREASVKHFRLDDGSYIAIGYETPVHYQADDGTWVDIDNTLELQEQVVMRSASSSANTPADITSGVYAAVNDDRAISFPAKLGDGALFDLTDGDHHIQLTLGIGKPGDVLLAQADEAEQDEDLQDLPSS